MRLRLARLAALMALVACVARADEIRLQFGALERMMASEVFTQEGRRYVKGNQKTRCNFAYLEHPQFYSKDGRLVFRALFSGRSALNMFRQCVGLGDAFTVVVSATPAYRQGNIWLDNVTVTSDGKTGFYIRRVCAAMATTLSHEFHYPLAATAQQALENPNVQPDYHRELRNFRVSNIYVTSDALVLTVDFQLTVK
jgi:hypothetical protein